MQYNIYLFIYDILIVDLLFFQMKGVYYLFLSHKYSYSHRLHERSS